jgi:hypothetical protein
VRAVLALLAFALAVVPACTQPIRDGADTGVDAPRLDAPADAPASDTPALDAPAPDAPGTDAPRADAPIADAPLDVRLDAPSPVDARVDAPIDAGPAGATCDDLFGGLPGYTLCAASATECRFGVQLVGMLDDCRQVCETAGYVCGSARRIGAGPCEEAGMQACGSSASPAICICIP